MPATSSLGSSSRVGRDNADKKHVRVSADVAARTARAGCSRAKSLASRGPARAAKRPRCPWGSSEERKADAVGVSVAKRPRPADNTGRRSGSRKRTSRMTSARAGLGNAKIRASAPRNAASTEAVIGNPAGSLTPGKRFWFSRRRFMSLAVAGVRVHKQGLCPLAKHASARLVPQAPAPKIAIRMRGFQ
jgi:hypothetical protein